jgi:hypothetical protein
MARSAWRGRAGPWPSAAVFETPRPEKELRITDVLNLPLPRFDEGVKFQKVYVRVWVPKDYRLVGDPEGFSSHIGVGLWDSRAITEAPENPDSWSPKDTSSFDFQVGGTTYLFSSLTGPTELVIGYWHIPTMTVIASLLALAIGVVLLRFSLDAKVLTVLALALVVLFVGLFAPSIARAWFRWWYPGALRAGTGRRWSWSTAARSAMWSRPDFAGRSSSIWTCMPAQRTPSGLNCPIPWISPKSRRRSSVDLRPLEKTSAGDFSSKVVVIYSGRLDEPLHRWSRVRPPAPQILSEVPVSRTLWTVCLPRQYEVSLVKGESNLEEVAEAYRQEERKLSFLDELRQILQVASSKSRSGARAKAQSSLKQAGAKLYGYAQQGPQADARNAADVQQQARQITEEIRRLEEPKIEGKRADGETTFYFGQPRREPEGVRAGADLDRPEERRGGLRKQAAEQLEELQTMCVLIARLPKRQTAGSQASKAVR